MPIEVWIGFNKKKNGFEETLKRLTNKKNIKLKMTEVLKYFSNKPIYAYDDEIYNFFVNKRRKQKLKQIII